VPHLSLSECISPNFCEISEIYFAYLFFVMIGRWVEGRGGEDKKGMKNEGRRTRDEGQGMRGRGDEGTRGRGDEGTRGQGDEGTRGQGDEGTRGRGDKGMRGRGDKGTRGRGDKGTRGQGDEGTRAKGQEARAKGRGTRMTR
jgi:hypothetical protein